MPLRKTEQFTVIVGGYKISVELPASVVRGSAMPAESWLPFSQTEQKVLRLLLDSGPLSREEIATRLNESVDGRIKGILATLVGRHVLLTTQDGYCLNIKSEDADRIRQFLDGLERGESPPPETP